MASCRLYDDGVEEDTLIPDDDIDPIYRLSSKVLEEYYTSRMQSLDEDEFESEDEYKQSLDLTGPPPESWFHGHISRLAACERVENVAQPGAYLVREIDLPGDYAICFLSYTGHVHHFKINSNCGDYYIGGRVFSSLSDLIGFYANCFHILENESLDVPVPPPKPVPLYMMLQATSPHTKNPNSDELSIAQGEVFLLMTKLDNDWGWGRSQLTGNNGLIPLVIMEDVTDQDSNFGKPWYHAYTSREEAIKQLMMKGEVGSFLLRKAGSQGGENVVQYSLSVRTQNGVHRFLVQKYITGYYVFGGRRFNSFEEIIERYRSEYIADNIQLAKPVTPDSSLAASAQSLATSSSSVAKEDININSRDKSGKLLLRKGKKSPIYSKWKEFYFVLYCTKQNLLLYYDHDTSLRARGLLDLRQCRVNAVHPSLFGRGDCLVVTLKYLNETSFYYLAAGSPELAQEWLRVLRECTLLDLNKDKSEIQQIKSLSLTIKDLKLIKNQPQAFSNVFVDGVCLARTRSAACNNGSCIFDENFELHNLSPYADYFSCEVQVSSRRGLGGFVGSNPVIGQVYIHFSDLPNGQDDDRWHSLLQIGGGARAAPRGTLRLVANFKHLPLTEYNKLKQESSIAAAAQSPQINSGDKSEKQILDAEEEKHIAAVHKAMENKGVLDHAIVHGVFVGLARSGKDSLMKRLLGKKLSNKNPSDRSVKLSLMKRLRKKLSSKNPSTGVAETTVQVKVMQKSMSTAANVEESCWTEMDYDDEAIKLMSISTYGEMLSLKQLNEGLIYQEGILVEALVTMPLHNEDEIAGNEPAVSAIETSTVHDNDMETTDHQEQTDPISSKLIDPPNMPDVSVPIPLDILKGALQSKGLEALQQHFQKTWSLYLTNTGGQMEFQEVLPLLVSGPSVFFFTFRLDRDLNEYYSIEYELATGKKSHPYTATSTTIEGILHTLASVSAMGTFVYQGLQKREAPLRPKVFFIGTHKDKLNPNLAVSRIASIDRQLQEIITSTTHFKDLVEFASPSQLFFTVNNFSESESDFQGIRSAVERVVMRGDFQMTSPAHWLIFSLALRKLEHPVVSYDHCYKIAQQCGIESQKELDEALYFIHSKMGLIRYFPYEELKDIVIIDPQFLFDKVTELIVDTFTFEKVGKSEMDEFKHKGIFSIAEFEQKTQSEIYSLQFGKLLVHLRIAAPFEMNKKKKLFLPCVLAHANKSTENVLPSTSVPALLIAFECGYCPKGVPGALIKYLMTNEMESSSHWILLTDKIFKDQISFRVGAYDTVVIKILPTHFELNCIPDPLFKDQRFDSPIESTCQEVLKALNTGIPQILKDLNYLIGKSQHLLTFQCKAPRCKDNSHPAQLILDSSGCSGSLMCQRTKQCFKLPTNSYYWGYGDNPCQESHLHASSRSEYQQSQHAAEQQHKHMTQASISEQQHSLPEHAAQASSESHTQLTEQSQNLVISSQQPTVQDAKNQPTSQLNVKQHYSILHKQLIKHSSKWTEIASHLGFLQSEIENIQAKPLLLSDAPACWFRTMLEKWLQWAPGDSRGSNNFATLEDLKEALSQAGLGVAAHDLHT